VANNDCRCRAHRRRQRRGRKVSFSPAGLQRLWLIEATRYNVLPIDDRAAERINPDMAGRPVLIKGKTQVLFGGMGRLSENCVLNIKNKSHSVTAEIEVPEPGAEGVIIAQGANIGGWSLYAKNGKLKYCSSKPTNINAEFGIFSPVRMLYPAIAQTERTLFVSATTCSALFNTRPIAAKTLVSACTAQAAFSQGTMIAHHAIEQSYQYSNRRNHGRNPLKRYFVHEKINRPEGEAR